MKAQNIGLSGTGLSGDVRVSSDQAWDKNQSADLSIKPVEQILWRAKNVASLAMSYQELPRNLQEQAKTKYYFLEVQH